jgi:hypothetical protein
LTGAHDGPGTICHTRGVVGAGDTLEAATAGDPLTATISPPITTAESSEAMKESFSVERILNILNPLDLSEAPTLRRSVAQLGVRNGHRS